MVIPPPLADTDPEPDIRSHQQQQDGHTTESHTPPDAFTSAKDGEVNVQATNTEQQDADTQQAPALAAPSPDSVRPHRPSFVSTIEDPHANDRGDDEPEQHRFTVWQSFRNMIRSVPLLAVVPILCPIAWALHFSHQNPVAVFVVSVLAIAPLAGGLGFATEELALRVGDAWGGLLNATFGNLVELLVAILALTKGHIDIVQASMAGSILSNILLVLGMSYFAGGLRFHEQLYGVVGAQTHISLLGISIAAFLLPEAYHLAFPDTRAGAQVTHRGTINLSEEELKQVLSMSRGLSIILLVVYGVYLTFQLWTHSYLFKTGREPVTTLPPPHHHRVFPRPHWVPSLRTVMSRDTWTDRDGSRTPSPIGTPVVRVSTSDSDRSVGSASSHSHHEVQANARTPTRVHDYARDPHAGHRHQANLSLPSPILNGAYREAPPTLRLDEKQMDSPTSVVEMSHAVPSPMGTNVSMATVDVERGMSHRNVRRHVEHPPPQTSILFAFIALASFTGLAGLTAECLVDSIDGMTERTNVSREWIGLIVLPVIGNAVEHVTAVTVSLKDRLNLSLSIAVGSSVQVSLCLIPLLVLLGWAIDQPMSLLFDTFETICLVVSVILVNFALTGRTNYLQGFTLMMAWVCIAVVCYYYEPTK